MQCYLRRFLPIRHVFYGTSYKTLLGARSTTWGYAAPPPFSSRSLNIVATLWPDNLISANQCVVDLSGKTVGSFRIEGGFKKSASLPYYRNPSEGRAYQRFPPDTRGVLYYSQHSEIRFRLCESVDDFGRGTDLLCPDGRTWNTPLARMVANPKKYEAILAFLKQDPTIKIDPSRDRHRIITTFSPENFMSSVPRVHDISGCRVISVFPGVNRNASDLSYSYIHRRTGLNPFPPNTKGVFYYHQSKTFPKELGELRFRLCSDARTFKEGIDLCLPSGDLWHVGSFSLSTYKTYRGIRDHLIQEQLLDADLYAGIPESVTDLVRSDVILNLGQPFQLDLSVSKPSFHLLFRHPHWSLKRVVRDKFFCSKQNPPSFSGRAVVCLEQYPTIPGSGRKPLLAIRFLEALTPIKRISTDTRAIQPVPGEFLTVSDTKLGYIPWGFASQGILRQVVADWIEQQSNQPVPSLDR